MEMEVTITCYIRLSSSLKFANFCTTKSVILLVLFNLTDLVLLLVTRLIYPVGVCRF